MEEVRTVPQTGAEQIDKAERKRTPTNTVMLVQTAVCITAVLLVFLLWKLSPQTFEFIKNEYNRIMSVDMSTEDIADSAKSVIGKVSGNGESGKKESDTEKTDGEEKTETPKKTDSRKTLAVMSMLKSDQDIVVPVHGEITSEYGDRTNPVTGEYIMHSGVDIAASQGTEIGAAYDGIVTEVGSNSVGGNYINLVHRDGSETFYCHCSKIIAEEGAVIRAGETIALVGSTGRSTGPHLHFEISVNGKTVDPLIYLPVADGAI